jgi:hypothetical protein
LWLIRDLPALIGITLSFWPLVIMVIANGAKAMRGKKISPAVYEHLMLMLPLAEAKLRHALYRQAFRAFGWNVRLVPREHLPPVTSWSDFLPRFEAYRLAMMDLRAASQTFTDMLRRHYRIRPRVDANAVRAARGSTDACSATTHEAVGLAASRIEAVRVALMVSSDRRERPSNHERGLANARGPPASPIIENQPKLASALPRV